MHVSVEGTALDAVGTETFKFKHFGEARGHGGGGCAGDAAVVGGEAAEEGAGGRACFNMTFRVQYIDKAVKAAVQWW